MMKIPGLRLIVCLVLTTLCCGRLDFSLAFAEEFRYDSHGRRDPFVSPAEAFAVGSHQIGHGELRLEGVIIDQEGGSYAIVNSQIVKEGELFEGFLLKKIEPNRAFFEKGGEKFDVVLRQDDKELEKISKS